MPEQPDTAAAPSLRSYWITAGSINALLLLAGVVYARLKSIPIETAAPIVAAFLIQAAVYLGAGFRAVRRRLIEKLSPARRAAVLLIVSLAPYLVYSLPLGLFSWASLAKLTMLCGVAAFLFALAPPKRQALSWQDLIVLAILVTPVISGATDLFKQIYPSPGDPVPRLDILGKLMVIALGADAYLTLRRTEGADFRLSLRRTDLTTGGQYFLYYLPIGIPIALAVGFVRWAPGPLERWADAAALAGKAVGIFFATALPEELCFRGILQRLLEGLLARPRLAQGLAALAFGLVHVSYREFPNWPFVVTATAAGWFYGEAYRRGGVPAAAVTHTLTVVAWTFLFD